MNRIFLFLLFITQILQSQEKEFIFNGQPISATEVLQKYIQIPSISGHEKEAGSFIKQVCKESDLNISDFGNEDGLFNFGASLYPLSSGKKNIILLNHIDVVPEGNDGKFEAYSGKIEDGIVYGRGAFDNKGAAIMQLESLIKFRDYLNEQHLESDFNVTFLAVSCEETQCTGGIEYVVEHFFEDLNPAMVIGEGPTEITSLIEDEFKYPMFGISVAHKRTLWLKLEVEIETPGHSSITPLQYSNKELVNALTRLVNKKNKLIYNNLNVNILREFGKNKSGLEKFFLKHPRLFKPFIAGTIRSTPELFALFSNTITLTNVFNNSKVYNKVPSKATAYLDCRLLPETNQRLFLNEVRRTLDYDHIKIEIVDSFPKAESSPIDNPYYSALAQAIRNLHPKSKVIPVLLPNINDLGVFRLKGVPAYACNPVIIPREIMESVHNKNERLPIKVLESGAKVYFEFLKLALKAD